MAHVVLNHPRLDAANVLAPELLKRLGVKEVKGRARYAGHRVDTPEEREAEEFVFYIQEQVFKHRRSQELTEMGTSIELLRPLLDTSAY